MSSLSPSSMVSKSSAYWDEDARLARIRRVLGEARLAESVLARCLPAMLLALDWQGAERHLVPLLPPERAALTVESLRALLSDLGYRSELLPPAFLAARLLQLPVGSLLLVGERCHVYLGYRDGAHYVHDGQALQALEMLPSLRAAVLVVRRDPELRPLDAPQTDWLERLVFKVRHSLLGLAGASLMINVLALAVSLFTMVVYNQVIPSGSLNTLWALGAGALLAVMGGWFLRLSRARAFAGLSAWAGAQIGPAVLRKTLGLPLEISSRVGVNSNINRIRSLEGVRQYLGGNGGILLVDLPFVFIFLLVIALLGGWIVLVPLVGLLLYGAAMLILGPLARRRASEAGVLSNRLLEEYTAAVQRLRALQGFSGHQRWLQGLRDAAADAAVASRKMSQTQGLIQSVAYALSSLLVLATMATGIALVLAGKMNTGGLIAAMMLIWRVTAPAQQFLSMQLNLRQMADSRAQLQRLMLSAGEVQSSRQTDPVEPQAAALEAERLFYRYASEQEAALNSVSFSLVPGQLIAVAGPNGAGKSTLLDCLAGIRWPQSGHLLLQGRDIRQFDPADYRASLGYLQQTTRLLPLALSQWLRLSHPGASDSQMVEVLARVGGPEWWRYLAAESAEQALDTVLDPWQEGAAALRIRYLVGLADALLDNPSLLLLDDPLRDADAALDGLLLNVLEQLHGKTTVVIATHRTELILRADAIIILDRGNLLHAGPVSPPPPAAALV